MGKWGGKAEKNWKKSGKVKSKMLCAKAVNGAPGPANAKRRDQWRDIADLGPGLLDPTSRDSGGKATGDD